MISEYFLGVSFMGLQTLPGHAGRILDLCFGWHHLDHDPDAGVLAQWPNRVTPLVVKVGWGARCRLRCNPYTPRTISSCVNGPSGLANRLSLPKIRFVRIVGGAHRPIAGALAEPATTKVTGCWRENAVSVTLQYRTSRPARAEAASRN